jgi:hypothetical protein
MAIAPPKGDHDLNPASLVSECSWSSSFLELRIHVLSLSSSGVLAGDLFTAANLRRRSSNLGSLASSGEYNPSHLMGNGINVSAGLAFVLATF